LPRMHPAVFAIRAIWLMLPAYVANPTAVLFGGGRPLDGGRTWRGKRILGDGKTWGGTLGGIGCGFLLGLIQSCIAWATGIPELGFGTLPWSLGIVLLLSCGAIMGDVIGAFVKRRRGLERGAKAPGLDQFDFVMGSWLLLLVFAPHFLLDNFILWPATLGLVAILVVTPLLHRGINIIGFKMGKKKEPW